MKHFGSWICLWCVFAFLGVCRGQEKIAISELLDLKMRTRALQEFVLRTDRLAEIYEWKDLAKFAKAHDDIGVWASVDRREKKNRYVVTWQRVSPLDNEIELPGGAYSKANFDRLFPPLGPTELILPKELGFSLFEEDGSLVKLEGAPSCEVKGFVTDLNGDGEIEVMQEAESGSVRYVTVRQLTGPQPLFAVAYEWGDLQGQRNAWGYAIRKGEDGSYDILFGPEDRGAISPAAIFRWDRRLGTWTCDKPDEHARVLGLKNVWDEVLKLGAESPSENSTVGKRKSGITIVGSPDASFTLEEIEKLPDALQSRPYRYETLAKLGFAELLAWMGRGRGLWDVKKENEPPSLPADFWTGNPKEEALSFVIGNRPKDIEQSYRLAIDDLDGMEAPEAGSIAISTSESGDDEHGIAEEYFLRCSRGDSYITVIREGGPWGEKDPMHPEFQCDVRKVALRYEEARRVIQTVWWLDRVRSKRVGLESGNGIGCGTNSGDSWASLRLETPQGAIAFEGTRYYAGAGRILGVADMNMTYDRTACLNLAAFLVCDRLPTYLGERWTAFSIRKGPAKGSAPGLENDYTPQQIADLKSAVAAQVAAFLAGDLSKSAAARILVIARELDLSELRPEVEKMAELLPPLAPKELELREISHRITEWTERLGPEGTDESSSYRRRNPEMPQVPKVSGTDGEGGKKEESKPPAPSPLSGDAIGLQPISGRVSRVLPPDPKFALLDALYAERDKISGEQSLDERTLKDLRDQIEKSVRWFSIENDPRKLYEFATEKADQMLLGCRRLQAMDLARAIAALEYWKGKKNTPSDALYLQQIIDEIQTEIERGGADLSASGADARAIMRVARLPRGANAETQAGGLMAAAGDAKRRFDDRCEAMKLLVPVSNPWRFPDPSVDEFLAKILAQKDGDTVFLWPDACQALAQRGGGKWWNVISAKSAEGSDDLSLAAISRFSDLLPALVTIAVNEGEPFRGRLHALLAPHLFRTNGRLDQILWAVWMADLRDLKPQIEQLATSNPVDVENALGKSESNQVSQVQGRYHVARQIASLWNEEEPATRAKMLIALGVEQSSIFGEDPGAERLRSALAREVAGLTPEQRKEVVEFVNWCASNVESVDPLSDEVVSAWVSKVKEILGRK